MKMHNRNVELQWLFLLQWLLAMTLQVLVPFHERVKEGHRIATPAYRSNNRNHDRWFNIVLAVSVAVAVGGAICKTTKIFLRKQSCHLVSNGLCYFRQFVLFLFGLRIIVHRVLLFVSIFAVIHCVEREKPRSQWRRRRREL